MTALKTDVLNAGELDHRSVSNSTTEPPAPAPLPPVSCLLTAVADLLPSVSCRTYRCPGETHSISHSVHLARMAAFYSKCVDCRHRNDGSQPAETRDGIRSTSQQRMPRSSMLVDDGVRGVYLNELDRTRASEWSAAFASMLWDEQPRFGSVVLDDKPRAGIADPHAPDVGRTAVRAEPPTNMLPPLIATSSNHRRGPVVVIGFDERPSSPDMVTGVALGLRRMGCEVVDLGQTTGPCLNFAVSHLDAAGGVFVTGAGCDPAWTGFQFVGRAACPWSTGGRLEPLESRVRSGVMRPTRTTGSQRTFPGLTPYEAGLGRFFHALRPLQIVCGSATRLVPRVLDSLFLRLPCRLTHESLPVRQRNLGDPNDADVRRVASAVVSGRQHLGLIIDDDGERCAFVTDRGRLVSPGELARMLIDFELREHRDATFVIAKSLAKGLGDWLTARGAAFHVEDSTAARLTAALDEKLASVALSSDHRVWFRGDNSICDAIRTLARVLQALSLSDTTMNDVVTRLSQS
jgi:Phosphoglucomutase/phosphomannomutase, alpha/beta/alpha domain I